ncbi:hypothetical protein GLX30_30170 [Streptomyces sp. Tu 2975]|uniref:hypothetical protein n=1 Tax=Streptomyces sp. Tu 2975 TaxID=2676871 RepID=UPI00135C9B33|nr:hypothetical protein [Streptomyces sp. Tu 2975]QIP87584.1 hypothetical protein GLX30_30170 [Streptomyces sp. Tu 2975]
MATVTPKPAVPASDELAGCIAEQAHLLDPADPLFVRLVCEHDDCCSTDADYPNWTPGGQA